jgi:hypothetical protein
MLDCPAGLGFKLCSYSDGRSRLETAQEVFEEGKNSHCRAYYARCLRQCLFLVPVLPLDSSLQAHRSRLLML